MKRLSKEFTLIELLVVIGIIAILAVVLIPKVREGLVKTKVTEAQLIAQRIESKMTEYNLNAIEPLNNIPDDTSQENIIKILAGVLPVTPESTEDRKIVSLTYSGDLIEVDGDEYVPRIPSSYFRVDDEGNVSMIKNGFGQAIQVVKRLSADRGTITLCNTATGDTVGKEFTRIRNANTKLHVFSVDDDSRIIGSKGLADKLNGGKDVYGSDLEFDTEL